MCVDVWAVVYSIMLRNVDYWTGYDWWVLGEGNAIKSDF